MRGHRRRLWEQIFFSVGVLLFMVATPVAALTSSSKNYQVTDTEFGATSLQSTCSGHYCATVSIGDATTGDGSSVASTSHFGTIAGKEPRLEVIIDGGASSLGTLSTDHTATKTMIVRVRNFIGAGYIVQVTGSAPKYGTHTLAASSMPTAAKPGTEQFALNAVKNTDPKVGADPQQIPDSGASLGDATQNYSTPNLFQYLSGDVVARGSSVSGETDYTISMVINISNATPPGNYSSDLSAVVIPTY